MRQFFNSLIKRVSPADIANLRDAIANLDEKMVRSILWEKLYFNQQQVLIDYHDEKGNTPLMWAISTAPDIHCTRHWNTFMAVSGCVRVGETLRRLKHANKEGETALTLAMHLPAYPRDEVVSRLFTDRSSAEKLELLSAFKNNNDDFILRSAFKKIYSFHLELSISIDDNFQKAKETLVLMIEGLNHEQQLSLILEPAALSREPALCWAMFYGLEKIAQILVQDYNPDQKMALLETWQGNERSSVLGMLHYRTPTAAPAIIKILLKDLNSAQIMKLLGYLDIHYMQTCTPLTQAIIYNQPEVLKVILDSVTEDQRMDLLSVALENSPLDNSKRINKKAAVAIAAAFKDSPKVLEVIFDSVSIDHKWDLLNQLDSLGETPVAAVMGASPTYCIADKLKVMFKNISPDKKFALLKHKNNAGETILMTDFSLYIEQIIRELFQDLTSDQIFELLTQVDNAGLSLLPKILNKNHGWGPNCFFSFLKAVNPDQRKILLNPLDKDTLLEGRMSTIGILDHSEDIAMLLTCGADINFGFRKLGEQLWFRPWDPVERETLQNDFTNVKQGEPHKIGLLRTIVRVFLKASAQEGIQITPETQESINYLTEMMNAYEKAKGKFLDEMHEIFLVYLYPVEGALADTITSIENFISECPKELKNYAYNELAEYYRHERSYEEALKCVLRMQANSEMPAYEVKQAKEQMLDFFLGAQQPQGFWSDIRGSIIEQDKIKLAEIFECSHENAYAYKQIQEISNKYVLLEPVSVLKSIPPALLIRAYEEKDAEDDRLLLVEEQQTQRPSLGRG